ncbi:MAG: DNA polymerase III subunit gamma/tau [Eubacteriales bacterium]|nr:DNA polymerase III subunit gamma/tau [Eubacteriales bacterium]
MYQALYRSFRPETFDGILGQGHIVKILKNQIATGTIGHAYLFCGTRGTGKTSMARILAKGVNCIANSNNKPCGVCDNCIAIKDGVFLDVIEIDAASNNGVENIRELRESVNYPPVAGKRKVYIIDEVHMLTIPAFNALLKTLEEPPEHVMFILATTEPHKLPATILSRCLRLDFRRISEQQMKDGLRKICKKLDVKISDGALGIIISHSDGSVRDGLSLLDQCIAAGGKEVIRQDVLELLGTSGEEVFLELTDLIEDHNPAEALLLLNRILADGKDVRQLIKDWIGHYRNLLILKFIKNPSDILSMSAENIERIRGQSNRLELSTINECILELSQTSSEAKWSTQPRILLELAMVKLATVKLVTVGNTHLSKPESKTVITQKPEPRAFDDLETIWNKVFEEGEENRGSFNLFYKGSRLSSIGDNVFHVDVANEISLHWAKDNEQLIESLMEKHTGRKRRMECTLVENWDDPNQQQSFENLAEKMGEELGIDIEVK